MKLDVLQADAGGRPWYADGLKFTCSTCGNCCTGGPGYVWVTAEEIRRLAEHLSLTPEQTLRKYCRKVGGRISFKERRQPNGDHDCIFLTEQPAACPSEPTASGGGDAGTKPVARELAPGEPVPLAHRVCSIYSVRPLQCRTWPFWPENLASREAWDLAARRCHGMDHGRRVFTQEQIETIRDATDWPQNPPTSFPTSTPPSTTKSAPVAPGLPGTA